MIDTANARRAGLPFLWSVPPVPDGSLDAADRRQVAGVWAFRSAGPPEPPEPPVPPPVPPPTRRPEPAEPMPPGSQHYLTLQGDTLDWVCWKHYGRTAGTVEAVLVANPKLADWGPVLPVGLRLVLPALPQTREGQAVRLWN